MSSFAEEESRSISENVTWAVRHRYAQGIYRLPGLLLGYRRSLDGEIQVDESGARVVRFIYLLALTGKSSTDICRILMDYGIPSPGQGHRWEPHTIRSILKNEKYMGDAILQKEITVDFLTKTRKPNEGEAPQYYVENGHPYIVSKSVWQDRKCKPHGRTPSAGIAPSRPLPIKSSAVTVAVDTDEKPGILPPIMIRSGSAIVGKTAAQNVDATIFTPKNWMLPSKGACAI